MSDIPSLHREVVSRVGIPLDQEAQLLQERFMTHVANVRAFAAMHGMAVRFTALQPIGPDVRSSEQLYNRLLAVFAPQPSPTPDTPSDVATVARVGRSPLQMCAQHIMQTESPILLIRGIVRQGVEVVLLTKSAPAPMTEQVVPETPDAWETVLSDLWLSLPVSDDEETPATIPASTQNEVVDLVPVFDPVVWIDGRSMRDVLMDQAFESLSDEEQTAVYHAFQQKK